MSLLVKEHVIRFEASVCVGACEVSELDGCCQMLDGCCQMWRLTPASHFQHRGESKLHSRILLVILAAAQQNHLLASVDSVRVRVRASTHH